MGKHSYAVELEKLAGLIEGMEFDWYVGIATGGVPVMLALSQATGVKNLDIYVPGKVKNFQHLAGQRVLLIDDVVETGKTIITAILSLEEWKPKNLNTISLSESARSVFSPDYCLIRNAERELRMRMEFVEREMIGRGEVGRWESKSLKT